MKKIIYLLLFLPLALSGQNLYTNNPEKVFPVLEEFISENHLRGTATFEKINHIDSIIVKSIPFIMEGPYIKKVYGMHHSNGESHWIEIDSSLLTDPVKFENTLNHELGHVFDLPHLNPKTHPKEIMAAEKFPYYLSPEEVRQARNNFFNSLKSLK